MRTRIVPAIKINVVKGLRAQDYTHNSECGGSRCTSTTGEVRVLPYPGGNLILCRACYEHEVAWRLDRNRDLGYDARLSLPTWAALTVYGGTC